ncbi:MAG: hypothetical protein KF805_16050 [Phycisphaeraceae bacterium]|nr:hypothetical protein [Phycisphaeraceae bacterium]
MAPHLQGTLPNIFRWTPPGRALVFLLSATSIWCLLSDFYGILSMRNFALWIMAPASIALVVLGLIDRHQWRTTTASSAASASLMKAVPPHPGSLARALVIGAAAGLIAAIAYDIFRLPFVFSKAWGLEPLVPQMNLFKVFPRFGAMLLGQQLEQPHYTLGTHLLGWAYHFSNGMTFGIMFIALIGDTSRRGMVFTIVAGIVMATGLEAGMLFSPYTQFFGIHLTTTFVIVTLTAHLIFGAVMGWLAKKWQPTLA